MRDVYARWYVRTRSNDSTAEVQKPRAKLVVFKQSIEMASAVTSTFKGAIHEPLVTGTLLYLLTRGPLPLREQILRPFRTNLLAKNGPARLAALITILKVLTSVGVLRRINSALNSIAWNNWKVFGRPGAPFAFGPGKEELVIITGGSSGFGYEMVKGFSKHARVVVLDISAFPPELARCKLQIEREECIFTRDSIGCALL